MIPEVEKLKALLNSKN